MRDSQSVAHPEFPETWNPQKTVQRSERDSLLSTIMPFLYNLRGRRLSNNCRCVGRNLLFWMGCEAPKGTKLWILKIWRRWYRHIDAEYCSQNSGKFEDCKPWKWHPISLFMKQISQVFFGFIWIPKGAPIDLHQRTHKSNHWFLQTMCFAPVPGMISCVILCSVGRHF